MGGGVVSCYNAMAVGSGWYCFMADREQTEREILVLRFSLNYGHRFYIVLVNRITHLPALLRMGRWDRMLGPMVVTTGNFSVAIPSQKTKDALTFTVFRFSTLWFWIVVTCCLLFLSSVAFSSRVFRHCPRCGSEKALFLVGSWFFSALLWEALLFRNSVALLFLVLVSAITN